MATLTFVQTATPPTLVFTDLSTYSSVDTTLATPLITFVVNDWNLNTTLNQPTLVFTLETGETSSLNLTLDRPTFAINMLNGQLFNVNSILPRVTLTNLVTSQIFYNLNKILPQPNLNVNIISNGRYTLSQTLRRPTLYVYVVNALTTSGATSKTYVLNTFNTAHTEYTNFDFNSYFKLGSDYYGVTSTGVYKLIGDVDVAAQITSEVHLPVSSFDKQGMKACSDAIVLGRLSGDVEIIVVTDEQEERSGHYIISDTLEGLHRHRVKIPKGLKGATWQFKIKNSDGSNFAINNLEVFLRELQRVR